MPRRRRSSCCCWAPPATASLRHLRPATSGRATARRPVLIRFQYHAFLAAMALVRGGRRRVRVHGGVGDRWRCRRSSWSRPSTGFRRSAAPGFLYLLIAHVGAIAILLCFGALQGGSGDYTFASMRSVAPGGGLADARPSSSRSLGFGAKAGLLPAARLAAGGAPGRAVAGVGADERRDAEDRDLRPPARRRSGSADHAQLWWWGVVRPGAGPRHRAVRRRLRRGAERT